MAVLLRAAERQHRAVVVPEVFFHLHPVHVGNAHVDPSSVQIRGPLAAWSETARAELEARYDPNSLNPLDSSASWR